MIQQKFEQQTKLKNIRQGATVVELALVVPILFLFVFAGFEFSRINLFRNTAEYAATEGARTGIVSGATAEECENVAQGILDTIYVQGAEVDVEPDVILPETPEITVTITIPMSQNALPMSQFILQNQIVQSITLPREIDASN